MDTDMNKYNSKWVEFHIRDHLEDGEISVRHTVIEDGEFHNPNDRRKSLHEDEIDEIVIPSDGIGEICAHGRRGSEGRLDLFHGNDKICELHWDNREGIRENLVEMLDESDKYRIEHGDGAQRQDLWAMFTLTCGLRTRASSLSPLYVMP